MTLAEQITADMKEAMKAKNAAALSTLRMLRSAIKNKQIDLQHELSDEEVQAVIKTQVKQLKDSLVSFEEAGRTETVAEAKAEITLLEAYLPAQMSDEDLRAVVEKVIADTGATSKADMGAVMGASMKAVNGGADGNRVKAIVQELLPVFVAVIAGALLAPNETFAAIPMVSNEVIQNTSYIEFGLRAFRVLVLFFGIASVVNILNGGFEYMNASMRDATHTNATKMMTQGVMGTIVVAGLFSLATVYLNMI